MVKDLDNIPNSVNVYIQSRLAYTIMQYFICFYNIEILETYQGEALVKIT